MELCSKQSPIKIDTKVGKDNSVMFAQDCSIYPAEAYDVPFQYNTQLLNTSIQSSSTTYTIRKNIKEVLDIEPDTGDYLTISASLTEGTSPYVTVNTRYGNSEIKEDCALEDTTGVINCKLWKSTDELTKSGQSYKFTHMLLKRYRGKVYVVSTNKTTMEEIQQVVESTKGATYLSSQSVSLVIEEFSTVKNIERYYSCSSCKKKITIGTTKALCVKCASCSALCKVSRLSLSVCLDVEFTYQNQPIWCSVFKSAIDGLIDVVNLSNDEIGHKVMLLQNIKITFDSTKNIISEIVKNI